MMAAGASLSLMTERTSPAGMKMLPISLSTWRVPSACSIVSEPAVTTYILLKVPASLGCVHSCLRVSCFASWQQELLVMLHNLRADSQQCMNEGLLSCNVLTTGTCAFLAATAKRSDRPKRQLFIDPRPEADSLLQAQKRKLNEWQLLTYGQHRTNDRKVVES